MYRAVVGVFVLAACGGGGKTGGIDAPPGGSDSQQPGCGDGIASGTEMCDGSDLRGHTDCRDLGYYDSAPLTCDATCDLVTSQCSGSCGDGIVQADHEFCDGADPTSTCTDFGFGAGALTCTRCAPDLRDCQFFGWHQDYVAFDIASISGTSDTNLWLTGADGTRRWDGATWQPFSLPVACGRGPSSVAGAVAAVAPDDIWLGRGDKILHITGSACVEYSLTGTNPVGASSIVALAANDVWAAGTSNTWHFDGQTWTAYAVGLVSMWVAGHDDVYGVDGSNIVHHFDGSSWTTTSRASQRTLYAIWGTSPNDIYAGGGNWAASSPYETAVVEHYDGTTWSELVLDEDVAQDDWVTSIAGADNHVFIGLQNTNGVRVLEPGGFTMLANPDLHAHPQLYALPGHLFVVPEGVSELLRFDGTDERDLSMGTPSSIAPVSANEMYGVVTIFTGNNHLYAFDGFSWREDTSVPFVEAVTTALSGDVLLLASDGIHTRNGSTWSAATPGSPSGDLMMWAASPTDVWLLDSAGHLHHWDGATDSVCATCTMFGGLRQLWGASSTDLYAVTDVAALMHWDGTAWSAAPTPPGFYPARLHGWGSNDMVAIADTDVWHYDGTTWTPMSFPFPDLQLRYIWGTSLHDLFVANVLSDIFHYDGHRWSPVKIPSAFQITGITGAGDTVVFFDQWAHHLVRTHPWGS